MSTTSPVWQANYHAIIFHPTEASVLMLAGNDGWVLPSFQLEAQEHMNHIEPIFKAMRQQLGIDTTILYCAYRSIECEIPHRRDAIYVLENRTLTWTPSAGAQWVGRAALADLALAIPGQRAIIDTCLLESEAQATPLLRTPWSKRGWFASVESWIQEQLAHLDYAIVAPIEQVKSWGISCILRVLTTQGNIYFKAIPTSFMHEQVPSSASGSAEKLPLLFAHEPALIQSLAVLYPRNMPTVLAMDRERCWMLQVDFGTELYKNPDKSAFERALRVHGQMQVAATQHIDTLFVAGCLDRRLHILEAQIDPLLSDEDVLSDLDTGQVAQLRTSAPRLKAMCHQLASYAVPQTLVHGDLHTGNIAVQASNYIYFDWTDGCVSHPFFDVATFLENVDDPSERMHLRDVYLSQWTDYEPMARLLEAFQLSQMLAAVHQAVSYQHIMSNVESTSKAEMRGGASYWLRILVQFLPLFCSLVVLCPHLLS
jgi:Phosphotransferase enzyme family